MNGRLGYSRPLSVLAGASRSTLALLAVVAAIAVAVLGTPRSAVADANPGPEAAQGTPGLPDGRVYELVSPANKPGSEAGVVAGKPPYIVSGGDGNEVAFSGTGPMGEATSGLTFFSVARHSGSSWSTHGAMPRGIGAQTVATTNPLYGISFSSEMGATVFGAEDVFVPEQALNSPTPHLYRYSEDGLVQWIGKPTVAEPITYENFSGFSWSGAFDGASPDFNTIYFDFEGALTPELEDPDPALGGLSYAGRIRSLNANGERPKSNDTIYEWQEGRLSDAAVLPDGTIDPYGAVPAINTQSGNRQTLGHQVSNDGRSILFLSPDPGSESGRPSELYLRRTASDGIQRTMLVSRDTLLPRVGGLPAGAPAGVKAGPEIYASPDGSRVIFESVEQLTSDAPNDGSNKEYMFDASTEELSYLPGVAAESPIEIRGSANDGSNFLFAREGELELWNEGAITEIAPFVQSGEQNEPVTRVTPDGSVYAFQSTSPFTAFNFNNGGGKYTEVYRYETATNTLGCVSCPGAGTLPSGNAALADAFSDAIIGNTLGGIGPANRGISEGGDRVFVDTPDALVPRDVNGMRDVYEWEATGVGSCPGAEQTGCVYLISSGISSKEAFFGDTSSSGNDVFFSTAEGLVPGDNDEGYDIYDARVPRPGDQLPPDAVPCEGAVCQGPPSVPNLLSAPASETLNGLGNPTLVRPGGGGKTKRLTRRQKLRSALHACARKHARSHRGRRACKRRARRRYSAKAALRKQDSHHNGRGNR